MCTGYALPVTQPVSVIVTVTLSAAVSAAPCSNEPVPVTVPPMKPVTDDAAILPPVLPSSPPHAASTTINNPSLFMYPSRVNEHHSPNAGGGSTSPGSRLHRCRGSLTLGRMKALLILVAVLSLVACKSKPVGSSGSASPPVPTPGSDSPPTPV